MHGPSSGYRIPHIEQFLTDLTVSLSAVASLASTAARRPSSAITRFSMSLIAYLSSVPWGLTKGG